MYKLIILCLLYLGSQSSIVSWDHFFATLHRYYNSLHEEIPANADLRYAYPQRMHTKGIAPQEVQGLIAVLQLISQVVKLVSYLFIIKKLIIEYKNLYI